MHTITYIAQRTPNNRTYPRDEYTPRMPLYPSLLLSYCLSFGSPGGRTHNKDKVPVIMWAGEGNTCGQWAAETGGEALQKRLLHHFSYHCR